MSFQKTLREPTVPCRDGIIRETISTNNYKELSNLREGIIRELETLRVS